MKKIVLLTFALVLFSTAVFVGFVRSAVAEGTIYIRSDGSVVPSTAPTQSFPPKHHNIALTML